MALIEESQSEETLEQVAITDTSKGVRSPLLSTSTFSEPEIMASDKVKGLSLKAQPPSEKDAIEPIAIVGFSMEFPQDTTSSEALWDIMMKKRSTASEFPKSRMNTDSMYHPDANRRGQVSCVEKDCILFGHCLIGAVRYLLPEATLLEKILPVLMLHSLQPRQLMQQAWIHSSAFFWNLLTKRSRMVSCSQSQLFEQ